ncbi:hypothetical protein A2U01_0083059, partial [Trifolium medium]|nr:hypothetical protein [Trifolium medium]
VQPPSGGVIAAQRRFANHSPLLITRYDQLRRLWELCFPLL